LHGADDGAVETDLTLTSSKRLRHFSMRASKRSLVSAFCQAIERGGVANFDQLEGVAEPGAGPVQPTFLFGFFFVFFRGFPKKRNWDTGLDSWAADHWP
jgi:hypothetical protein